MTAKTVDKPKIIEAPKPVEAKPAPAADEVVLEPRPPETAPLETASTAKAATPDTEKTGSAPASAPTSGAAPAQAATAPVAPTILNNPVAKEVEAASKTETVVAAAEVEPEPAATKDAPALPEPKVESWTAPGTGVSIPPLAFAILIAAATLAVLLLILKKQSTAPVEVGPVRVPIEPTLPGLEPAQKASTGQSLTLHEAPDPPALSAATATSELPATRADALKLLGLNTDASEAVIRKLVEALRQSWHPDLATSETDRAAREERIKTINVAADILLRARAA